MHVLKWPEKIPPIFSLIWWKLISFQSGQSLSEFFFQVLGNPCNLQKPFLTAPIYFITSLGTSFHPQICLGYLPWWVMLETKFVIKAQLGALKKFIKHQNCRHFRHASTNQKPISLLFRKNAPELFNPFKKPLKATSTSDFIGGDLQHLTATSFTEKITMCFLVYFPFNRWGGSPLLRNELILYNVLENNWGAWSYSMLMFYVASIVNMLLAPTS